MSVWITLLLHLYLVEDTEMLISSAVGGETNFLQEAVFVMKQHFKVTKIVRIEGDGSKGYLTRGIDYSIKDI